MAGIVLPQRRNWTRHPPIYLRLPAQTALGEKSSTKRNEPYCLTLSCDELAQAKTNERKSGRVGNPQVCNPQGGTAQPDATQKNPLRSEATMHTHAQVRKPGGRLSREDQRSIGDALQRVHDERRRQRVPDGVEDLLRQFDRDEKEGGLQRSASGKARDTTKLIV